MSNQALRDLIDLMRLGQSADQREQDSFLQPDAGTLEAPPGDDWWAASTSVHDSSLDEYDRQLLNDRSLDRSWAANDELSWPPVSQPLSDFQQRSSVAQRFNPPFAIDDPFSELQIHIPAVDTQPFRQVQVRAPLNLSRSAERSNQRCATSSSSPFFVSSPAAEANDRRHTIDRQEGIDRVTLRSSASHHDGSSPGQQSSIGAIVTPKKPSVPDNTRHSLTFGPVVQGIPLVPTFNLPDPFQSLFMYPIFNAMQSKCYRHIYQSDENFVMSGPTGSGKTAILELAICKLFMQCPNERHKAVYMAPTKALCGERAADWSVRFRALGLVCEEITGDTPVPDSLPKIQSADIIVTTPEKWDSVTRKWRDYHRLMLSVKLLLIDEVHILGDGRGAALEVIVSRMKSIGAGVRFVALSATIPNIADIAEWLGKNPRTMHIPANLEAFGEEFRPVQLERHVFEIKETGSGYSVDSACTQHIPGIIAKHSKREPIMIFCFTKKSCEATARLLRDYRQRDHRSADWWPKPKAPLQSESPDTSSLYAEGIAIHHGDLRAEERTAVESGFLGGHLSVICCTSTLAVGVNLPCHMVIIKNTLAYSAEGLREYTDLEIMQMLGRAGRPQFQSSGAVAIIMTQKPKVERYMRLVSGQATVESKLHMNLIEHMNAEIALGSIASTVAAEKWLEGTFLHIRVRQNPDHYRLGDRSKIGTTNERMGRICRRDVDALLHCHLIERVQGDTLRCTAFGEAMARYYVRFATMKTLLALGQGSSVSETLTAISEADEFSNIRFRQSEATKYAPYLSGLGIRFVPNELSTAAQKIFIIVQIELGSLQPPRDSKTQRPDRQYLQDRAIIFNSIQRLVRCAIDCQVHLRDGLAVKNSLELARSLSSMMWDDSSSQLQLIPGIGPVISRKLLSAGIQTIEALADADPAQVSMLTGKRIAAERIYQEARLYPIPKIQVNLVKQEVKDGLNTIFLKIEAGFKNKRVPDMYKGRINYICVICETSDHNLIDFRRVQAANASDPIFVSATLTKSHQFIHCYVVCDELIGTLRSTSLQLNRWSDRSGPVSSLAREEDEMQELRVPMNSAKKRSRTQSGIDRETGNDDFIDLADLDSISETDLLAAGDSLEFVPVEQVESADSNNHILSVTNANGDPPAGGDEQREARKLPNGNYECHHKCKDKTSCRHLCCREGLDRLPRPRMVAKRSEAGSGPGKQLKQPKAGRAHELNNASRQVPSQSQQGPDNWTSMKRRPNLFDATQKRRKC